MMGTKTAGRPTAKRGPAEFADGAATLLLLLGGAAVLAMMVHIAVEVVIRRLFGASIPATQEIVMYYYMVACTFLPLAYVQKTRSAIVVELLTAHMPERRIRKFDAVGEFLSFLYFGLLAWTGLVVAIAKTEIRDGEHIASFNLATWPMRWVLFVSCAFAALLAISNVARLLRPKATASTVNGAGTPSGSLHH